MRRILFVAFDLASTCPNDKSRIHPKSSTSVANPLPARANSKRRGVGAFAGRLAHGGLDLETVLEMMRHTTIAMTGWYLHLAPTSGLDSKATLFFEGTNPVHDGPFLAPSAKRPIRPQDVIYCNLLKLNKL